MMDSVPMTREGYNKIKAEIERLENEEMPAVTERLHDYWEWIRGHLRNGYWNQEILNLYFQGDDLERIARLPVL